MRYLTALLAACLSVASFAFAVPCLDPLACNFMEEGECFFTDENGDPCVIEGCTIEGACNYDPAADIYDGSCEFVSCLGCTDSEACNYDQTALYDDATCIYYVDCNGTCGGDWIEDACGNCFAQSLDVIIEETFNYTGDIADYVIPYSGFYEITCAGARGGNTGDCGYGGSGNGQAGTTTTAYLELTEGDEILILAGGIGGSLGSGSAGGGGGTYVVKVVSEETDYLFFDGRYVEPLIVAGGGAGGFNGITPSSVTESDSCLGGLAIGEYSSNYSAILSGAGGGGFCSDGQDAFYGDGGSSFLSGGASVEGGGFGGGGGQTNTGCNISGGGGGWTGGNGCKSTPNSSAGSSYVVVDASEYSVLENSNDGAGWVTINLTLPSAPLCNPGCTYPQACNYNPDSNFDNGSCDYCFCGEGTQWVDSLQACMVTEEALMQACGEGTYWDDLAQACLTIETCQEDLDGDGIVGINDLLELLSSFGSECVIETSEASEFMCCDPVNYHGYDYPTKQIGYECWFAENLQTEHYANGDAIPGELSDNNWMNTTEGAQATYGNEASNLSTYGRLYNWYAVDDARGLCPSGWHVPTYVEFTLLEEFLVSGWSVAGDPLKSSPSNIPSWDGTNTSGFSALPGGIRDSNGLFLAGGTHTQFWSSSSGGSSSAYSVGLFSENSELLFYETFNLHPGKAIRCVQDSE